MRKKNSNGNDICVHCFAEKAAAAGLCEQCFVCKYYNRDENNVTVCSMCSQSVEDCPCLEAAMTYNLRVPGEKESRGPNYESIVRASYFPGAGKWELN